MGGKAQGGVRDIMLRTAAAMSAALAIVSASTAHGASVADQINLPTEGSWSSSIISEFQQVVTPGISGPLAGIELFGVTGFSDYGTDTLRIRIAQTSAWTTGPFEFSGVATLQYTGTYIDVSSANINVIAGVPFVIDLGGGDGSTLDSFNSTRPTYGGGDLYESFNGSVIDVSSSGVDLGFVTYVGDGPPTTIIQIPAPPPPPPPFVPEPATWAMMLLGAGAVGAVMRRRRQDETALGVA